MTKQIHEDKYNRSKRWSHIQGTNLDTHKSEQIMSSLILRGTRVGHCFNKFTLIFTLFQILKQPSNAVKQVPPPMPDYNVVYIPVHSKLLQINKNWLKLTNLALQPSFIFGPRTPITSCLKKNSSLTRSKILENQNREFTSEDNFLV